MNKAVELFDKILVNGQEINLTDLDNNNGKYHFGEANTNVEVNLLLKDKTEIPSNIFKNVSDLKSIYIPETVKRINDEAFEGCSLTYINIPKGLSYISYSAFNNISLPEEIVDQIKEQLPSYIVSYISSYMNTYAPSTYTDTPSTYTDTNTDIEPLNGIQYTSDVYEVGDVYEKILVYTERSGQHREQIIGTCKLEIVEIDHELDNDFDPHADQFRLKIKVTEVNITNPLSDVDIDYESEILNRYFWTQATFIMANVEFFSWNFPNWRQGIDGVDSFFAMEGEGDTYYPELENFFGVTDYAVRKVSNDEHKLN